MEVFQKRTDMIERQQRQQWEGQTGEEDEAERPVRKLTPKAQ